MTGLVNKSPRVIADGRVAVDFQVRIGNRPSAGPVTTVLLRSTDGAWAVASVTTPTVQVAVPIGGRAISSPLAVSGRSEAFEATLTIRVLQMAGEKVTRLAETFVNG